MTFFYHGTCQFSDKNFDFDKTVKNKLIAKFG